MSKFDGLPDKFETAARRPRAPAMMVNSTINSEHTKRRSERARLVAADRSSMVLAAAIFPPAGKIARDVFDRHVRILYRSLADTPRLQP